MPGSPELADLLAVLGAVDDSPTAAKDRAHPAFLNATGPPETRVALTATRHGMRRQAGEVHGLLNGRDDRQPDDPQVARAAALEALLPDALATQVPGTGARCPADIPSADLAPAQAAAVRRALELVRQRQEESP
ncbi:hypothetical protein AB0I51_32515 [Streptomyces sp. NPDC050549]|uniref:hypothetical protein n=1 Tax=Streptomyces sp. NPDC050549 TaxID=3155406 RepID=UPI00342E551F